jgi:hypothetical protein
MSALTGFSRKGVSPAVPLKIRATGFAGRSHSAIAEIQLRSSDLLETGSIYSRKIKGLIHFFSPADAVFQEMFSVHGYCLQPIVATGKGTRLHSSKARGSTSSARQSDRGRMNPDHLPSNWIGRNQSPG